MWHSTYTMSIIPTHQKGAWYNYKSLCITMPYSVYILAKMLYSILRTYKLSGTAAASLKMHSFSCHGVTNLSECRNFSTINCDLLFVLIIFQVCYTTVQSRCLHSLFTPRYVIYSKWGGNSCSIMWCYKKLLQEHCNHYMCNNHLSCRLLGRELFDCRNTLVCGLPLLLRLCISIELHNDSVFHGRLFRSWCIIPVFSCTFIIYALK